MGGANLAAISLGPGHLEHMRRLRYQSGLAVPLVARGRTLGVFAFVRRAGRTPYGEDDVRLAVELGRRAATALDNARLFAELSATERRLEAILGNLAEAVTVQGRDLGLLYVNRAGARLLECESPEEALTTPMPEILDRFVALDEDGRPFDYANLPGRDAIDGRSAEPVLMRYISKATGHERWMLVKATPVRGDDGEVLMAVNVMEDVTEARRAEHHQRFLAARSKLLASTLDVDETRDRAAAATVPEIADWCCIDVPDARGVLHRRALAVDPARREAMGALRGAFDVGALAGVALADGRPRLYDRVDDALLRSWAADDAGLQALRAAGLRSLLVVPLVSGDRPSAVITMASDASARALGQSELYLANDVAARAAVAIENARVHGVRTHIAATLQRSLLPPRLPAVPGMTIAARFRAAGEATEVGGDFYDLFSVDDAWMVVMGDITGKGPEAASITSLARSTMRTAAVYERSPAGVLQRPNAALVVDPERRQLCTVVAARIVPAADGSAVVTVTCGGHPAPFHLHDGTADAVPAGGPPPGGVAAGPRGGGRRPPRAGREPRALHRRRHRHAERPRALRRRAPRRRARRRDRARARRGRQPGRRRIAGVRGGAAARRRRAARAARDARGRDRGQARGRRARRRRRAVAPPETSGGCGNIRPRRLMAPERGSVIARDRHGGAAITVRERAVAARSGAPPGSDPPPRRPPAAARAGLRQRGGRRRRGRRARGRLTLGHAARPRR